MGGYLERTIQASALIATSFTSDCATDVGSTLCLIQLHCYGEQEGASAHIQLHGRLRPTQAMGNTGKSQSVTHGARLLRLPLPTHPEQTYGNMIWPSRTSAFDTCAVGHKRAHQRRSHETHVAENDLAVFIILAHGALHRSQNGSSWSVNLHFAALLGHAF